MTLVAAPVHSVPSRLPVACLDERVFLRCAHFMLYSTSLPLITETLPLAEQVRRALIRNRADTSHSEVITGKRVDGTPLEGHEHAHYLPTDEDGDGRIDHLTIYAPRGFDGADVDALGSLRTIFRSGNRAEVRMILIGLSGKGEAVRAGYQEAASREREAGRGRREEGVNANGKVVSAKREEESKMPPIELGDVLSSNLQEGDASEHFLSRVRLAPRGVRESNQRIYGSGGVGGTSNDPPDFRQVYSVLRQPIAIARGTVTVGVRSRPPASLRHREQAGEDARVPSIFASSKRWRSVTPFSLPRFPNRGGGKPPRPLDLPEAQLVQELKLRGLPEPISIKRIEGYRCSGSQRPEVGGQRSEVGDQKSEVGDQGRLIRWLEFHTRRFKGTQGKGLAGFEIEFAEPVAGPIAVGFGCHFGLGLFAPF